MCETWYSPPSPTPGKFADINCSTRVVHRYLRTGLLEGVRCILHRVFTLCSSGVRVCMCLYACVRVACLLAMEKVYFLPLVHFNLLLYLYTTILKRMYTPICFHLRLLVTY